MYNREKGFGFFTTDRGDVFFHISNLRIPRPGYDRPYVMHFPTKDELDRISSNLKPEMEVEIVRVQMGKKGVIAEQWTLPCLKQSPMDLYVVYEEQKTVTQVTETHPDGKATNTSIVFKHIPVYVTTNILDLDSYVFKMLAPWNDKNYVIYRCHTEEIVKGFDEFKYSSYIRTTELVSIDELSKAITALKDMEQKASNVPPLFSRMEGSHNVS